MLINVTIADHINTLFIFIIKDLTNSLCKGLIQQGYHDLFIGSRGDFFKPLPYVWCLILLSLGKDLIWYFNINDIINSIPLPKDSLVSSLVKKKNKQKQKRHSIVVQRLRTSRRRWEHHIIKAFCSNYIRC